MLLKGKKILIGITGGIAAYRVYDLIRNLTKEGAEVKVVLTKEALNFVNPLVVSTLSGNEPYHDWNVEKPLLHIELAKWCDVFLVAPATVNTISKLALGIADNLLTATWFACSKPKLVAPAANTTMLLNPSVQKNLKALREEQEVEIVPPKSGLLACGDIGEGKLADIEVLRDYLIRAISPKPLKGKKVLITTGATKEFLDPVRFISNGSSGRMGLALTKAVFYLGGEPLVVAGDIKVQFPQIFKVQKVTTIEEMLNACLEIFPSVDMVLMNAAVTDYKFSKTYQHKLKKKGEKLLVELEPTPDILAELGKRKKNQLLVGFAVESDNLIENAIKKLQKKNLDAIVVNPTSVMGSENYEGTLITSKGERKEIKEPSKELAAYKLLMEIVQIFNLQG